MDEKVDADRSSAQARGQMQWHSNLDRVKGEVDVGLLNREEWVQGVGLTVGGLGAETRVIIDWVRSVLAMRYLFHRQPEYDFTDNVLSRGMVLLGPHGSGKSTLARAVAFEHGIFTSERKSGSSLLMARRYRGGARKKPDGPEVPGRYNANGAMVLACRALAALSEDEEAVATTLDAAADAIFRAYNKKSEPRDSTGSRYFNLVLLVLDDVDALNDKTSETVNRFCAQVRRFPHVALAVLATSNSWEAVPKPLKDIFDALNDEGKITLRPLSPARRLEVLTLLLASHGFGELPRAALESLADSTHGFQASDLMSLCQEIAFQASGSEGQSPDDAMLRGCVQTVRDLLYRRNSSANSISLWSGSDRGRVSEVAPEEGAEGASHPQIGLVGLEEQLLRLHLSIVCALEPSTLHNTARGSGSLKETAAMIEIQGGAGCLLYGPAGTGKSALIRFTARQCRDCNVVSLDASSMISKRMGETEKNISAAFADAKTRTPCLIIIDQLESLAGNDGGENELVNLRRAICLARELDDVCEFNTENLEKAKETGEYAGCVRVLASTTRIKDVHPRIIQGGSLVDHVLVPMPSTAQLTDLLQFYLCKMKVEPCEQHGDSVPGEPICRRCLSALAQTRCQGFSGADIENVAREAGLLALRRSNLQATHVAWQDIHSALAEQTKRVR